MQRCKSKERRGEERGELSTVMLFHTCEAERGKVDICMHSWTTRFGANHLASDPSGILYDTIKL